MPKYSLTTWLPAYLLLAILAVWVCFMLLTLRDAALDDRASGTLVVVFPPSTEPDSIFNAVLLADGRLVNGTWLKSAWIVHSDLPGLVGRLKMQGAWAAFEPALFQPITVAGCFLTSTANAVHNDYNQRSLPGV